MDKGRQQFLKMPSSRNWSEDLNYQFIQGHICIYAVELLSGPRLGVFNSY